MPEDSNADAETDRIPAETPAPRRRFLSVWRIGALSALALALLGGAGVVASATPPAAFPAGERIEILPGTSLVTAARMLEDAHAVHSSLLLQLILIAQAGEGGVKAGIYRFDEPLSVFGIAHALLYGTHSAPLIRITIPEGMRNGDIDKIVTSQLPAIPPGAFERAAADAEGYLFPETYHVPEIFTAEQLVDMMKETFAEKTAPLADTFAASTRTREEIIIMASILEREADSEESMRIISGILWKRFDKGMPLQVDASFAYLLGKKSEEVTVDDLALDSPYNTYKYWGLPPTPLNNPGLQAIKAALSPTPSPYLYYLTDAEGAFHYAKTFEEHKKNKQLFLE
ncbi:endolytic transglycosylase MltG [Candidatus Kaiserbacteria bacterium]|nr:endolytic transglycosylase MltG [Candidatus Kaiserbacteria bacterium]